MNINDYRNAMDTIVPGKELKDRILNQRVSSKHNAPIRRILACAMALALMLTCGTCVALAANPELRTAVLSFFHLKEREQLPSQEDNRQTNAVQTKNPPAQPEETDEPLPDITQAEIGSLVKAQYIQMDQTYGLSGSLLHQLTWSEDYRTLVDAKFWEIQENQLIPVQPQIQTNTIDITFRGSHYQGSLYWFLRDGELYYFQGVPLGIDTRPEDEWYVQTVPGHTDVVLLKLAQGQQIEYTEYPLLYYLDTGKTEDFLVDTGADRLERAYDYQWSKNMRKALISCSVDTDEPQEWLCDLDAGTSTRLDELTGMGQNVSAGFADNDTLILTTYTVSETDGTWRTITCYAYDLPTGQMTKTLDETHFYRWWDEPYGAQRFGSRCILTDPDGQATLVDLKTGEQTAMEGFRYQEGDRFMISPSGNQLLYYASDSETDGLGITQLGVIDLERNLFIAFDREGYENLYEEGIGWSSDHTVSIHARSLDRETRYLILYTF